MIRIPIGLVDSDLINHLAAKYMHFVADDADSLLYPFEPICSITKEYTCGCYIESICRMPLEFKSKVRQ
jgi:hypothetical protein